MKKVNSIFLILAFFGIVTSNAQTSVNYEWAKKTTFGNNWGDMYESSFELDHEGNIYMSGYFVYDVHLDPNSNSATFTNDGFSDFFIAKYDADYNLIWAKATSNNTYSEEIKTMKLDNAGNIYVAGYFMDTVDFDLGTGVAKLSAVNFWADAFIAKYDASGNYLWAKAMGGDDFQSIRSIQVSDQIGGNSGIYVTGGFDNTVDFDPNGGTENLISKGDRDVFVAKYDDQGNYIWAKNIGGSQRDEGDFLQIDQEGNIYVGGYCFSDTVDFDPGIAVSNLIDPQKKIYFIAKYDNSGSLLWAKDFGFFIGSYYWNYTPFTLDPNGNILITGSFTDTVDFDPGIGVANLSVSNSSFMASDIFIAKYDALGNYIWAKNMGGAQTGYGTSIDLDLNGNIYITGSFGSGSSLGSGTVDFDPGNGIAQCTSSGSGFNDLFIAKYDASGNYVWAKNTGSSSGDNYGSYIKTDASDNLFMLGYFQSTMDFDWGTGTANLTSTGTVRDMVVAKYSQGSGSSGINENPENEKVIFFPNPANELMNIYLGVHDHDLSINIMDMQGKTTCYQLVKSNDRLTQLNVNELIPGIYMVKIIDNKTGESKTGKFAKAGSLF